MPSGRKFRLSFTRCACPLIHVVRQPKKIYSSCTSAVGAGRAELELEGLEAVAFEIGQALS